MTLKDTDLPVDDETFKNLLSNLIFLLTWPFENNVPEWIAMLMTILAVQCKKFKLLVHVCEENCDYVNLQPLFCLFVICSSPSDLLVHKSEIIDIYFKDP